MPIPKEILAYNAGHTGDKRICDTLAEAIDSHFAKVERRVGRPRSTVTCKCFEFGGFVIKHMD